MSHLLIELKLLCAGLSCAQVGINSSSPLATLDIRATESQETARSNEGVIPPKLSKTRISNIETPVEGTLVYVDEFQNYSGTNLEVSEITETGYYYYNGSRWVSFSSGTLTAPNRKLRTTTGDTVLELEDNGGYVYINSNNPATLTVPDNLPIGFSCVVVQKGEGEITVVGASSSIETARGTKTRRQHSAIGLIKDTATSFTITGDAK